MILPRVHKSPVSHRLTNIHAALSRGDLDSAPHNRPAAVQELRRVAHDLQALAVLVMATADDLNDSNNVFARMKATEQATKSLQAVLGSLKSN